MPTDELTQFNVRVPLSLVKAIKVRAIQEEKPVEDLAEEALRRFLGIKKEVPA